MKVKFSKSIGDSRLLNFVAIKPTGLNKHSNGTEVPVTHNKFLANLFTVGYFRE